MSGHYILSPLAKDDVRAIWDYTVARWGVNQAERYIRQLQAHIEMLAEQPTLGRPCFDVRVGYYKYPSGSHTFFFRVQDDLIDIIRILHARMDFERHLP